MASSEVKPSDASEPNKAFMAACSAKSRERARVRNGHLTTLSRLVLYSPTPHPTADSKCKHWSVVPYGDFKWIPGGISDNHKMTLKDRTTKKTFCYISPTCPQWESYCFARVEYGEKTDGIFSFSIHKLLELDLPGLSEDDVWADLSQVIMDHNALVVAGNNPEKAYCLLANSWRDAIFLKYAYVQVRCDGKPMKNEWKILNWCSHKGGNPMALRFLDNPKTDPLEISATSAEEGGEEDNGDGVQSVDASDDEYENAEENGAGDVNIFQWKTHGICSNAFHIQAALMPPPSNLPAKKSPAKKSPAKRSPRKRSPAKKAAAGKPRQAARTRSKSRGGGTPKGQGGKKGGAKSPAKDAVPPPGDSGSAAGAGGSGGNGGDDGDVRLLNGKSMEFFHYCFIN